MPERDADDWAAELAAAPRHHFVPDRAWDSGRFTMVDRATDPDAWDEAVQRDASLVTQVHDGHSELTAESAALVVNWTSSCSAPGAVLAFLRLLDPYPGDHVLEVGTGTGWTAALLSARVGAQNVTSIEVDEQVAKQAAANLEAAGFAPRLVIGDGALGHAEGAPYDRVHVTCGVRNIPYAWVAQTRPGGIIACPWMPDETTFGYKARLTTTTTSAVGRLHGAAGYMMLRSQRLARPPIGGEPRSSVGTVDPRRITAAGDGLRCFLAGALPGVNIGQGALNPVDGTLRIPLRHEGSDSHAIAIQPTSGGPAQVEQRGPRDLWHELEAAYLAWVRLGEPDIDRFGLEADVDGTHVWLDHAGRRIKEAR